MMKSLKALDEEITFTVYEPEEAAPHVERIMANQKRLLGCDWHDFRAVLPDQPRAKRRGQMIYRCEHCGGEIDYNSYRWHELGRRPQSAT